MVVSQENLDLAVEDLMIADDSLAGRCVSATFMSENNSHLGYEFNLPSTQASKNISSP